jgi:outer membrane protein
MRRNRTTWAAICAAAIACITAPGLRAQQPTEARIQELIRLAAEQAAGTQSPAGAQPSAGVQSAARPVVRLTLEEAVNLALEHNLDIAVQRLNPQTFDFTLASLRSVYAPALTSQLSLQSVTSPSTSTVSGNAAGAGITQHQDGYNAGLSQSLPWGGASLSATMNNGRTMTSSLTALFNPSFNPNWSATYTQPLLRGFKIDSTRRQLLVQKLNQEVSETQLQATIINTLSNVRNAYWDYVFAVQSVEVARQSVALAERLVQDNEVRVQVGTMAPIDVVQAKSQAATARQTLVGAQSTRQTAELSLKRLIVAGTEDQNWNSTLDPVDRPEFRPEPVDVDAAIRRALGARTDLVQARKNVQSNDITVKYLRNQLLPQMDFVARGGLVGLGGIQYITVGSGITRTVIGTIPGGYAMSVKSLLSQDFPTWNLTMNISYPLGTSAAEANVARARVQLNQTQAQLHQIELQVATEVTNAATVMQSSAERVQAAQAARDLAQQQLDAENSKFEVGMSTNYLVVQSQRDLATAQNNELQAILNYRKALVEMERLQQTTLQNLNITILSTTGGVSSGS